MREIHFAIINFALKRCSFYVQPLMEGLARLVYAKKTFCRTLHRVTDIYHTCSSHSRGLVVTLESCELIGYMSLLLIVLNLLRAIPNSINRNIWGNFADKIVTNASLALVKMISSNASVIFKPSYLQLSITHLQHRSKWLRVTPSRPGKWFPRQRSQVTSIRPIPQTHSHSCHFCMLFPLPRLSLPRNLFLLSYSHVETLRHRASHETARFVGIQLIVDSTGSLSCMSRE